MAKQRPPLAYYLALEYPYTVIPDNGSYVIEFPDLPNCFTQVEDARKIPDAAEEIRLLWIEGEYEDGHDIPEPIAVDYSGKFVARVPKSLHRDLVEAARREGMSLNSYVCYLLTERNMTIQLGQQLDAVSRGVSALSTRLPYNVEVETHEENEGQEETSKNLRIVYRAVAA